MTSKKANRCREVPESDKRVSESGRKVGRVAQKWGESGRFGAEWALRWADTGATRTHRARLEGPTGRTPGPLARPSGGTGGRLAAGRVATRCGESPGPGPTRRSEWELATTVRAATSSALPVRPLPTHRKPQPLGAHNALLCIKKGRERLEGRGGIRDERKVRKSANKGESASVSDAPCGPPRGVLYRLYSV